MIRISPEEISRWRAEVDLALEFRDKEFGTYRKQAIGSPPTTTLAGRNLDYFEQGSRTEEQQAEPPLNVVYPIVKNVIPTLYYQNPRVNAIPVKSFPNSGEDAFYVAELINQDLKDIDFGFKSTIQSTVFDSYVLGYGVVKVGYATEFGQDILPTEAEDRKKIKDRLKDQVDKVLEGIGLKKPEAQDAEPEKVQADSSIRSENSYVQWISPWDFLVDPRARNLNDARWIAQRICRTLAEVKKDRRYGQAKHELRAGGLDDNRVPESYIEDFQTVDIWEIHYKAPESETGIRILTIACTQAQTKALMHDDNVYDLGGWQYEWLTLNKHGHRLYPISTLSVIRPLIDRINSSFDAILEQVDKFQSKVAYNDRVTFDGEKALDNPEIGQRIKISGMEDVSGAIRVISMDQVKGEMINFVKNVFDFVVLIVGLTQAQLTGLSTAQTATEAQIGQGGQNLRRNDESNQVGDFCNRVITKFWRVKAQFETLQDTSIPMESPVLDPSTGISSTQWYPPIDEERASRLKSIKFKFSLEMGSMQRPNLEIVRAQFEQFARALMEPAVTNGLALEGKRLSASEIIRQWSRFFMEYGLTEGISKMIVPVQDMNMQQSLMNYGQKPSGATGGELTGSVPNMADMMSASAGEKGQGVPGA